MTLRVVDKCPNNSKFPYSLYLNLNTYFGFFFIYTKSIFLYPNGGLQLLEAVGDLLVPPEQRFLHPVEFLLEILGEKLVLGPRAG
jgi:hypothetical protein